MESPDFPSFACTDYSGGTASKQKMSIPLVWIIKNFHHSRWNELEGANAICGLEFKFHPLSKVLWKLEICNKRDNDAINRNYTRNNYTRLTLGLRQVSECQNTAVQFTIYWSAKTVQESKVLEQYVTCPANVRYHEILNFGINDFRIIYGNSPCNMVIQIKTDHNVAQQFATNATCVVKALDFQSSLDKGKVAVLADMESILKEAEFADAVLKSEGNEIRVHRSILAGRSAVFKSMFQHQMSENASGIVNVSDISYKTLQLFVPYLYSGRLVDLDVKSATELFVASDKYAVEDLYETCSLFLKKSMAVENCLEILVLADTHSNEDLKSSATTYFTQHFEEICRKSDWENVIKARPNISYEMLNVLASKR